MKEKTYVAIDLKSFYASVECVERELDPLKTNLVVADLSRTEKTICLAVSPSLKAHGIAGRARLFEVVQRVGEVNSARQLQARHALTGKSWDASELEEHPDWAVDYIVAPPRMSHYMEFSARIYGIYLRYAAPEDIHVYSVDEVFIDATPYLRTYGVDGRGFAEMLIRQVLKETGITATAGIGTNLYLSKVAMDIVAKRVRPDSRGVRIAELTERSYRELLWDHRPLTDFWRVGHGYARKLERYGMFTMGDIARCSLGEPGSLYNEDILYRLFGVAAELLIDHAWGVEPCTIADIRAYRPSTNSVSTGQVLSSPYSWEKARIVIREMADALAMDLTAKGVVTRQLVISVGYDADSLKDPAAARRYTGPVGRDHYGRSVPKPAHGSINLEYTSSVSAIMRAVAEVFDKITDPLLLVRRLNISAGFLIPKEQARSSGGFEQMDLFEDPTVRLRQQEFLDREEKRQQAVLKLRSRFGKNAVLRGLDLEEGATMIARNGQIGGHKA